MGFFESSASVLFRGALASYILLYAINIKTHPEQWSNTISSNIATYSSLVGLQSDNIQQNV